MAFYVPLGPRGLLFRIGTFVIGIWGGVVYGRRAVAAPSDAPIPAALDHLHPRLIRLQRAAIRTLASSDRFAASSTSIDRLSPRSATEDLMCGIAGAIDLTGTREFSPQRLLGDDRGDRPSRARRRAVPHRAGRRAGSQAAVDHRPGGRPSADRQRRRLDLGRLQRRALRVSRAAPAASCARAPRWRPAATPRPGSISTKTIARGCLRRPAASSPSRSGTATRAH